MPVKKIKKKQPPKKIKKEKQIETDIKEAVKKIPEFLFTKVEAPKSQENTFPPLPPKPVAAGQPPNYQEFRRRRSLLLLTIIIFSVAILGMWIWNINTLWKDAGNRNSSEKELWQEAKAGIAQIKTSEAKNELSAILKKEETKQNIKNQIEAEILKAKIKNVLTDFTTTTNTTTINTP